MKPLHRTVSPSMMAESPPQQFAAALHKQGPNPYVNVPEEVSRAFSPYQHGGRIAVEGTLNGVSIFGHIDPFWQGTAPALR